MSTAPTPGYLAVLEALATAGGPGLHSLHVRRVHNWHCVEQRTEFLWFGGRMVAFGYRMREAFEDLTTLVDDAMNSGLADLTILSNLPGMTSDDMNVHLFHIEAGRCVTAEEHDRERYGQYPESLAAAERLRRQRETQARTLYKPRALWETPDA